MASPQSERFAVRPDSRVSLTDESIWKRLREAGFDEDAIKRRDKASLIAYIAKLEAEIYDHQHHMGLLILEKKGLVSKYEQIKVTAESAELMYKRDQAAHSAVLAEARKREDNLKKALGVEKECVANIEKALHEMRAESAETKVAAEIKLVEARSMVEDAQKKFTEAEAKLHAAESLEAEASRYHRAAERKLHEVEAREDDLRRRTLLFKTDCDAKEKEILLERQSLCERHKTLQQSQERLLDGQALLNQREDYIFNRSQELTRLEKELEASKSKFEKELKVLSEEKTNLELKEASLSKREEAIVKRECEINKKNEDLLILRETLASKESDGIQLVMANHETALKTRKIEFEAEFDLKRKLVDEEIETKRRAWELREVDLRQREDLISEKEHDLEIQSTTLADKEKDLIERLNSLEEKEKSHLAAEREVKLKKAVLLKEKEDIDRTRLDVQKSLDLLEERRKQINHAEEKVEAMKNETQELLVLETRLKEEIDMIRAQKHELEVEADELKAEKSKFETEWELIDEKREELRKEAERIGEERSIISKFLKDERDSLKLEKDALRDQYKNNVESLSRDREAFMSQMEHERSEWFSKIQKERADFLRDIELQRSELENCFDKRREEIESYHREKERAFEEEKKKELEYITSLRETVAEETEQVNRELKRLDTERKEINLDRERRDKEWAELNESIEELKLQREKLEKQRELLHLDREGILSQIDELKKLEDLKAIADRIAASEIQEYDLRSNKRRHSAKRFLKQQAELDSGRREHNDGIGVDSSTHKRSEIASPPFSAPFSWLKRCADSLLDQSQSKKKMRQQNEASIMQSEEAITPCLLSTQQTSLEDGHATMSFNRTPEGAEETTVYIDKIITVREVTTVDVGKVTGDSQHQHDATPQESDDKLELNGDLKSDTNGKVNQNGERRRTRSKQY